MNTVSPKIIAIRSLIALVALSFGVIISAQIRSVPDRVSNPIVPYVSLKETKEDLYSEQENLKVELKALQTSIREEQKKSENSVLSSEEIRNLEIKKAKAGLTEIKGRGIIIKLNDSNTTVVTDETIVHAADLRDVTNLLWSSGAEAVSINNQRVVANTAVDCIVNTILINGERITAHFLIEAIGNQKTMYENLLNQNHLVDLRKRQKENGIIFSVSTNNEITVPIFNGSFSMDFSSN